MKLPSKTVCRDASEIIILHKEVSTQLSQVLAAFAGTRSTEEQREAK